MHGALKDPELISLYSQFGPLRIRGPTGFQRTNPPLVPDFMSFPAVNPYLIFGLGVKHGILKYYVPFAATTIISYGSLRVTAELFALSKANIAFRFSRGMPRASNSAPVV